MTEKEAIQMLERILDPDPWEDDGLSDKAKQALQMGIDALEKRIVGKEILEKEQSKYSGIFDHRPEYSHGRISGLYDGLGIDYSD